MSAQDNATTLGKPNQNLVLETAGRIYVKVQDRFYELDFRNQGRGGGDTKIEIVNNSSNNQDIDLKGYVTKEFLKASLNSYVTKRSWNDVKETQSMLENAMLDGFTESINPITIQTMQVIVGADQLQFEFVNNFTDANETTYGPNLYKNSIEFIEPSGGIYIKHYTLDGPTDVRPEDPNDQTQLNQLKMQYCRWRIAPNRFDLGDPSASYYIYIKVPRLRDDSGWINSSDPMTIYTKTNAEGTSVYNSEYGGLGEFVLSNTAIEMTSESHYYYLLYGMINSDDGSGRSFSTMNGFTEILPGQITAYIFKSASGDSYLDLRKNELKLGDAFQWNINNNHILYIKGAIVVDDGGNQSNMQLDRGMFHRFRYQEVENGDYKESDFCNPTGAYHVEGNIYYPGNVVTWTDDKGLTSSYIYIYKPTQPNETQPNAYYSCDYDTETIEEDSGYNSQSTYYDPTNEKYWRVLAKGVRGYSNLIADLTNEMEAIACDKDGYVIAENGLDVVTQIGLYYGASDVEIDKDQTLVTLSNPEGSKITIDLSEILTINPQPVDPNALPNPTVTVSITAIQNSYLKTLTFSLDHGVLLSEKCEIPITVISKDKFGEDQDDTRTIVFTLVGVRSGKAYSLVPSARTIRRTPLGLYDPSILTCGVVCNGTSENVVISEIVVKHVRGERALIHTQSHPEGVWVNVDNVSSYLNDFINDHITPETVGGYCLDWDYTTQDGTPEQYISFENPTYEKITFFLYYKDPLSNNWILCDKETILVVKDGDPGKDFSISSSSQVFMYETETSKIPLNSAITLTGVPKNIKEVDYYEWKYRIPEHPSLNVWTSISPAQGSQEVYPEHSTWWRPDDDPTEQGYQANEPLISTLIIHAPIEVTNNGVTTVNYRDFDTYFPRINQNDETTRYRMCEFQVTIHYKELGVATSLSDSTSLHIIKGGDGSFTTYLTNPSMIFASTEKKGVSLHLAEEAEVVAYYGLDQILPTLDNNNNISSESLITADIIRYKYKYVQNKVEYDSPNYIGSGNIHIDENATEPYDPNSDYYESIPNVITANVYVKQIGPALNQTNHLFVQVNTGQYDNQNSFYGISGEIDVQITLKTPGKLQEEHSVIRTIYWNTAKQGEIGIAKQPRGRSDFNSNGYCGTEMYQGTTDDEDNWEGGSSQPWNDEKNIFFDIVRIPGTSHDLDKTYYCIKGGPGASLNTPGDDSTNWTDYWKLMTYANIAASVAWIDKGLIEDLTVKKLQTKGENYTTDIIKIEDNWINVINSNQNPIINLSTNNLPPAQSVSDTYITSNSISITRFNTSGSGSALLATINNLSSATTNVTTIPSFTIECYVHLAHNEGSGVDISDTVAGGIRFEVWLSTQSGSNTGYFIDSYQNNDEQNTYYVSVPSYVVQLNPSNTWYLNLIWSYSLNCDSFILEVDPFTITTKYQSANNDGTIIAGNGFQTQWTNASQSITSTINVNGNSSGSNLTIKSDNADVNLYGTIRLNGNYVVGSSSSGINIYIIQNSNNPSMTADGLYFLY